VKPIFAALCALATIVSATTAHAKGTIASPQGWPRAIQIDKIGVKATVDPLALYKLGPLDQTPPWQDVGWWDKGFKPGDLGTAQIYGHVDSYSGPAVFWNLSKVTPGDTVKVRYQHGAPLTFRVIWSKSYPSNGLPMKWLTHSRSARAIALITCSGVFHGLANGGYDHKLLVYARMVLPNGRLG
jgi:sortase A